MLGDGRILTTKDGKEGILWETSMLSLNELTGPRLYVTATSPAGSNFKVN